jgi:hypothetical protein
MVECVIDADGGHAVWDLDSGGKRMVGPTVLLTCTRPADARPRPPLEAEAEEVAPFGGCPEPQ